MKTQEQISSNFGQTLSYSTKSDKIVIGAPNYPGGGAVFECHLPDVGGGGGGAIVTPDPCTRLFESEKYEKSDVSYDSSNERLGSSIYVTKKGDTIACAPRFQVNLKCTLKSNVNKLRVKSSP